MQTTFQNFSIPQTETSPKSASSKNVQNYGSSGNVKTYTLSSAAALGTGVVLRHALFKFVVNKPILLKKRFLNALKFNEKESAQLLQACEETLVSSGLKDKGITIKYLAKSEENRAELTKIYSEIKLKSKWKNWKFIKRAIYLKRQKKLNQYLNGTNACYMDAKKAIWVNEEKLIGSVFHELGHAKSAVFGKGRLLCTLDRILRKKTSLLFLAGALLPLRKNTKEDGKGSLQRKADNALVKSLPFLYLASKLPLLMEEATASKNGLEMAKKVLSGAQLKTLGRAYKIAFSTYLVSSVIPAVTLGAMIFVKNKLQNSLNAHSHVSKN